MTDEATPAKSRGGRPRDPSRDAAILTAALEVLGETGYEKLTMDQVAARAHAGKGTMYRRWASKADLILDAVSRMHEMPQLEDLPDTGSIRGDLVALMRPQSEEDNARTLAMTSGLASLLSVDPALADAAGSALVEPFVASQRMLLQRAVDRGEISPEIDIETIAYVTPSMTAFQLIVQRRPVDVDHILHLVETVILPALGMGHRTNATNRS